MSTTVLYNTGQHYVRYTAMYDTSIAVFNNSILACILRIWGVGEISSTTVLFDIRRDESDKQWQRKLSTIVEEFNRLVFQD